MARTLTLRHPRQGLGEHEVDGCTQAFVLAVAALWLTRLAGNGSPGLPDQLRRLFVQAHHRALGVVGAAVDLQHVRHTGDELGVVLRRNPAAFALVGLEFVFLSVRMTVGAEIDSTTSKATSFPASMRKVQRARPAGGSLQASCTSRASFSPSTSGCVGGRSRVSRNGAASSPRSKKRWRILNTVRGEQEQASAACSSLQFSPSASTCSGRLACSILYAAALPLLTTSPSVERSSPERRRVHVLFKRVRPDEDLSGILNASWVWGVTCTEVRRWRAPSPEG